MVIQKTFAKHRNPGPVITRANGQQCRLWSADHHRLVHILNWVTGLRNLSAIKALNIDMGALSTWRFHGQAFEIKAKHVLVET